LEPVLEYTERLYQELHTGCTEFKESEVVALKTRREMAKRYLGDSETVARAGPQDIIKGRASRAFPWLSAAARNGQAPP
jgi:hypothetical protein